MSIKVVNFIWIIKKIHKLHHLALKNNVELLKSHGWSVILHTDDVNNLTPDIIDNPDITVKIIPDEMLEFARSHRCCNTPRKGIRIPHVVDLLRYMILIENGGAYIDMDDFLLVNPEEFFNMSMTNFTIESRWGVSNNVIYTPAPNDPFLRGLIEFLDDPRFEHWTTTWACTGPIVVTEYLKVLDDASFKEKVTNFNHRNDPDMREALRNGAFKSIHVVSDDIYPFKYGKWSNLIETGAAIDLDEWRAKGVKVMSMYGSDIDNINNGNFSLRIIGENFDEVVLLGDEGRMK